jgi:hypothetical protein
MFCGRFSLAHMTFRIGGLIPSHQRNDLRGSDDILSGRIEQTSEQVIVVRSISFNRNPPKVGEFVLEFDSTISSQTRSLISVWSNTITLRKSISQGNAVKTSATSIAGVVHQKRAIQSIANSCSCKSSCWRVWTSNGRNDIGTSSNIVTSCAAIPHG